MMYTIIHLRHCWVGLIDWCVNYLMVSINRLEEMAWFEFFTYWFDLSIHDNLVQQIDHLFLHISLGRISSSFLLCNKVSYLDLHSNCLKMDWYLKVTLLSSFGQLQSLLNLTLSLSTSSSIGIYGETGQLYHSCSICTTNLPTITTSTSSSSSIHSFIHLHDEYIVYCHH